MELRHLRYFVIVANEQSVTRAAKMLHLSQPALSRQIRDLEAELGTSLFQRSPNSLRLSETGHFFLGEAQAILQRADFATKAVQKYVSSKCSELRVGYSELLTTEILPQLLKLLKVHAPKIRPVLQDKLSGEIVASLGERVFDVGLTIKPRVKLDRSFQFDPLREYRVGILVRVGHKLEKNTTVSPREIVDEPLAIFSRRNPHYQRFLRDIFRSTNRQPPINLECDSPASLLNEVASGRSIAVLFEIPKSVRKRLVFIPFAHAVPPVVAGILYRTDRQSAELREFIRISKMLVRKPTR
jgi:LysR family transcriptional regulator, benzoate and cis,cis-muconate-responsive activator of ben and cat genes